MAFENLKKKFDRMKLELVLVAAMNKGSKTMAKLCRESFSVAVFFDGDDMEKTRYVFTVCKVEWVEGKIYKKSTSTYDIPASLVGDKILTAEDVEYLYGDFMVDRMDVYVDEKNKIVDYQGEKGNSK